VRQAAAHAKVQTGGGQHDVVGPGGNRCDDAEYDKRNKQFRFDE
jgi:hypothetical protein